MQRVLCQEFGRAPTRGGVMRSTVMVTLLLAAVIASSATGQQPDPIGIEFRVNTYTTGPQVRSRIVHQPDGGFVVVWESLGSPGTDASSYSIQGRRYDSAGTAQGGSSAPCRGATTPQARA